MGEFKVNLDQANQYIENFIDTYEQVASNKALGGNLEKGTFNQAITSEKDGMAAWFCWNDGTNSNFPSFFMAFEAITDYSKTNGLSQPENNSLIAPGSTFTFSGSNKGSVLNHHSSDVNSIDNSVISKANVVTMNENFVVEFNENTSYPYSFFNSIDDDDLEDFVNQNDLEYIAYFFGYSNEEKYSNNKLRLILTPLDGDGKVITSANAIYLQKSWPPPPFD